MEAFFNDLSGQTKHRFYTLQFDNTWPRTREVMVYGLNVNNDDLCFRVIPKLELVIYKIIYEWGK